MTELLATHRRSAGLELDLRIVACTNLVLHEEPDQSRTSRLTERVAQEGILRNPPVVTPLGPDDFMVLDGANRTSALVGSGVPHAVVQVVDYDSVTLRRWHHLLLATTAPQLLAALGNLPDLQLGEVDAGALKRRLESGTALAGLMLTDGPALELVATQTEARVVSQVLRSAVASYARLASITRVDSPDASWLAQDRAAALVMFRRYRRQDLLDLADQGALLPAGITRHIIPRRALRLNIGLDVLRAPDSLETKNAWLEDWITRKHRAGQVRHYPESTVLFDE